MSVTVNDLMNSSGLTLEDIVAVCTNRTATCQCNMGPHDEANDAIWILSSTFIIFTMQSGFGLLESGSVTIKNEVNIMVKNAADVLFGGLTYWMFGYAISFGNSSWSNSFCGWGNFFVSTSSENIGEVYSKFFFQASFATTATTIVSGAMAERTKLESYILFSMMMTVVYCFPAHWVWANNGWLRQLGMVDVAGAGAVHLIGGTTGLVATLMLKPRHGRFQSQNPPPMGSPTNAILGLFMLWWGWLGFNCGSTFGISGFKWKLAARSAVSTLVASIAGGSFPCGLSYIIKGRKVDINYMINGILGALVGITAFCALADPWESFLIGLVGAAISRGGIELLNKLHIDDPVGVVGVHGCAGIWSLLSVGLFAKKDSMREAIGINHNHAGVLYGGDGYLLGIQALGVVAIMAWTAVMSWLLLKMIDITLGLRVPLNQEILGADVVEHNLGDIEYDKVNNTVISLKKVTDSTDDDFCNDVLRRRLRKRRPALVPNVSVLHLTNADPDSSDKRDRQGADLQLDKKSADQQIRYDSSTLWRFAIGKVVPSHSCRKTRKRRTSNCLPVRWHGSHSKQKAKGENNQAFETGIEETKDSTSNIPDRTEPPETNSSSPPPPPKPFCMTNGIVSATDIHMTDIVTNTTVLFV